MPYWFTMYINASIMYHFFNQEISADPLVFIGGNTIFRIFVTNMYSEHSDEDRARLFALT